MGFVVRLIGDQPVVEGEGGDELEGPWDASLEGGRVGYGSVSGLDLLFFAVAVLPSLIVFNILAITSNIWFQQCELGPGIVEHQQKCRPEKTIETRHIDALHHSPRVYRTADHDGDEDGDILPS